ncbi:MAG: hypothetical protein RMJ07_04330 [Nitrososphaerota archaeon]|nr:hypothetical protein [Candidatus Bathyarchaeota archaeon]MDW8048890.1 hypothetical protein [Nitrososphaerota archaeon]
MRVNSPRKADACQYILLAAVSQQTERLRIASINEKTETNTAINLLVGVMLIFAGAFWILMHLRLISLQEAWPYVLLLLGIAIIAAAVLSGITAVKRHPKP